MTRLLPTSQAFRYCGFKTASGLHAARRAGKVRPAGRRGGTGPLMWDVVELDRFLRGVAGPCKSCGNLNGERCDDCRGQASPTGNFTKSRQLPTSVDVSQRARLDANKTATPKTEIVAEVPVIGGWSHTDNVRSYAYRKTKKP